LFSRTKNLSVVPLPAPSLRNKQSLSTQLWIWFSLALGVLWLVPAIFVLSLNFRDQVVGAGVGCLFSQSNPRCRLDYRSSKQQIQQTQDLTSDDERALAGLQIAAKALEAWFSFIAASLVYCVLKRLAGQDEKDRLPVGFIHIHTECGDLRILPKLFWDRRRDAHRLKGWSRNRLHLLIAFVVSVCILCNLMGPATAILVIPNLRWIDINKSSNGLFHSMRSFSRPLDANVAPSCTQAELIAGSYSCTAKSNLGTTDMVAAAVVATDDQSYTTDTGQAISFKSLLLPPVLQEANVSFTINFTDYIAWIPSRQTLRALSADLSDYAGYNPQTAQYPDSSLFNHSLQTRLLRRGPLLGHSNQCFAARGVAPGQNWKAFNLTNNQMVRCYSKRPLGDSGVVWKCIPVGAGWAQFSATSSQFRIEDWQFRNGTVPSANSTGQTSNGDMMVKVNSANASFDMDDSTFQALGNDFNWAAAFSKSPLPTNTVLTGPRQIVEYTREVPFLSMHGVIVKDFIYCDSQAVLSLADFVLSPSDTSNAISLVEVDHLFWSNPEMPTPQPLYIHPDWSLAAWSVDNQNDYVGGRRGAARKIGQAFESWIAAFATNGGTSDTFQSAEDFRNIFGFMGAQTLSMIPYTTIMETQGASPLQPPLPSKASIQIWKYDLRSLSSIFGFVTLILGIICVLARTVLYAMDSADAKDATEILITALRQMPSKPNPRSKRNSSVSSLLPPGTPPDIELMEEGDIDDEIGEKEFPIVQVHAVSPTTATDETKQAAYKRRVWFHG
jgi:hypothetical protein